MWVHAMYKFYHVNKGVAPKKAALKQASIELKAVEGTPSYILTKIANIIKANVIVCLLIYYDFGLKVYEIRLALLFMLLREPPFMKDFNWL